MGILITIILGGIVGYVAARLLGRNEGILGSIVIGIIGAFIGGFLSSLFTGSGQALLALTWPSLIWATIGALVLVAILNAVTKSHRRTV